MAIAFKRQQANKSNSSELEIEQSDPAEQVNGVKKKVGLRIGSNQPQSSVDDEDPTAVKKVRLSADLHHKTHRKLKMYCAATDKNIVDVVEEFINNLPPLSELE